MKSHNGLRNMFLSLTTTPNYMATGGHLIPPPPIPRKKKNGKLLHLSHGTLRDSCTSSSPQRIVFSWSPASITTTDKICQIQKGVLRLTLNIVSYLTFQLISSFLLHCFDRRNIGMYTQGIYSCMYCILEILYNLLSFMLLLTYRCFRCKPYCIYSCKKSMIFCTSSIKNFLFTSINVMCVVKKIFFCYFCHRIFYCDNYYAFFYQWHYFLYNATACAYVIYVVSKSIQVVRLKVKYDQTMEFF